MPNTNNHRRQIVRACKRRGWTIQPEALQRVEEYLALEQQQGNDEAKIMLNEMLDAVADRVNSNCNNIHTTTTTLTGKLWESVVEDFAAAMDRRQSGGGGGSVPTKNKKKQQSASELSVVSHRHSGNSRSSHITNSSSSSDYWTGTNHTNLQIVNAFQTPKLLYDVMRKNFRVEDEKCSLFGEPEDKIHMLAQRYALTHQRVLRHKLFQPADLHATEETVHLKLTPVESLLGKDGRQSLLLLGVLVQIEEGQWYLEDPTGQVPVSFQESSTTDDFFVTEHNILLVEGLFQDGILHIQRLGHPLIEPRTTSLQAIRQQVFHPSFRKPQLSSRDTGDHSSFVILSDVHLDQPQVIQNLETMWAKYETQPSHVDLPLFILMGNFSSVPLSCPSQLTPLWDELASVLSRFPRMQRRAHVVLVPGPHDGVGHVLPFPAVARTKQLTDAVENLHLASNPCRVTWRDQEMVVFRYDVLHLMQHHQLLPLTSRATSETDSDGQMPAFRPDSHSRLFRTILDQGHLLPVAGVPMFWQAYHSMSLYPLPTSLVLADGGGGVGNQQQQQYEGVQIIQPGSLSEGNFAVYNSGAVDAEEDDNGVFPMSMESDSDENLFSQQRRPVEMVQIGIA